MNAVTNLLREFDVVTEEYNRQKAAVTEQLKPQFHDIFKDYLEAHPCIEQLEVVAYTPYFMDGDECIYSVGTLGATLVDFEVDYAAEFFESYSDHFSEALTYLKHGTIPAQKWSSKSDVEWNDYWVRTNQELLDLGVEKLEAIVAAREAGKDLVLAVATIPDDVFRDMFGDHVKVIIDRDGVRTEEYDHD